MNFAANNDSRPPKIKTRRNSSLNNSDKALVYGSATCIMLHRLWKCQQW